MTASFCGSGDVADENLHFFVLPCRSQDGGSPRGAVPGTKVKAFDQDNRIGDMRMDRPDDADRFVDLGERRPPLLPRAGTA